MSAPTIQLVLTDDEFLDRFQPITNHLYRHAGFDGCLFETYGAELAFVQAQDPALIWTVLDCDGNLVIGDGYHFVNRLGYLIATVPREDGHSYEIETENLCEGDEVQS